MAFSNSDLDISLYFDLDNNRFRIQDNSDYVGASPSIALVDVVGVYTSTDPNSNILHQNADFNNPDVDLDVSLYSGYITFTEADGDYIIDYSVYDSDTSTTYTKTFTFTYDADDIPDVVINIESDVGLATISSTDETAYGATITLNTRTHTLTYPSTWGSTTSTSITVDTISLTELYTGEYSGAITSTITITGTDDLIVDTTITGTQTHDVWDTDGMYTVRDALNTFYDLWQTSQTGNPKKGREYSTIWNEINSNYTMYNTYKQNGDIENAGEYLDNIKTLLAAEGIDTTIDPSVSVPVTQAIPGYATQWLDGRGVPADSLGRNGDYYYRIDNGFVYNKQSGSWVFVSKLVTINEEVSAISNIDNVTSLWLINAKAKHYDGYTYFVYIDFDDNKRKIIRYSHTDEEWSSVVILDTTSFLGGGNADGQDYAHAAPSVFVDSDGYINVSYTGYKQGTLYNIKSSNPNDISSWNSEVQIVSGLTNSSYAILVEVDGDYVMFYRSYASSPIIARKVSSDNGTTWGAELEINNYYPYYVVKIDSNDRIHLAWHYYDESLHQNLYYTYCDDIKEASPIFYNGAGVSQTLPLTTSDCKVYDSTIDWEEFYIAGIGIDSSNKVHIVGLATDATGSGSISVSAEDQLMHYEYTSGWNRTVILSSDNINRSAYAKGVIEGDVKCDSENNIYCCFCIDIDGETEIYEYKSPNNGIIWIKNKEITAGSNKPNTLPDYVVDGSGIKIMWFSGEQDYGDGKYIFYR